MGKTKKTIAIALTGAMVITGAATMTSTTDVKAATTVNKKGYTLSKKAGTYKKTVKVKIKAKKGYKVYYTTNGKFQLKKIVKSGKTKTVTISSTKTLSIYCVKKSAKVTAKTLKKTAKKKAQKYKYTIKKATQSTDSGSTTDTSAGNSGTATGTTTATQSPAAQTTATPTAVPTATPTVAPATTPERTPSTTISPVTVTSETSQTIDVSTTGKISEEDTNYTYKKSKKNKITIMAPGTYTIDGNGETVDTVIDVDLGETYTDTEGNTVSYETLSTSVTDGVNIILKDITITDTNSDFKIQTTDSMTSDNGIITVKSSDKLSGVKITVQGEVNLSDTGVTGVDSDDATDTTYPAGIVCKKTPLELDGSGTLSITSEKGNGIKSTDTLAITDVTVKVGTQAKAVGHNGITAKTILNTKDSDITVYSTEDSIKTTFDETDAASSGTLDTSIEISGGDITLNSADGDGISGSYTMNEDTSSEQSDGVLNLSPESLDIVTAAATKTSDSADDTIHGNGDVTIQGGTITVSAADDGIHADGILTITAGSVTVSQSYEGLEGMDIDIKGGTMNITASDDGLNAAGGSDSQSSSQDRFGGFSPGSSSSSSSSSSTDSSGSHKGIKAGSALTISSGTITVDTTATGTKTNSDGGAMGMEASDTNHTLTISGGSLTVNAEGDGIDSNGSLYITGGTTIVNGPSSGGNGSLDIGDGSGCVFQITGGTLWAFAGTTDMVVTPTTASPAFVEFTTNLSKGATITVKNSSGNEVASATTTKAAKDVIYYGENLTAGASYSLYSGSSSVATATSKTQGSSSQQGGGGFRP